MRSRKNRVEQRSSDVVSNVSAEAVKAGLAPGGSLGAAGLAPTDAMVSLCGLAVAIVGFALGVNILAVNDENGACRYVPWPWLTVEELGQFVIWAQGA